MSRSWLTELPSGAQCLRKKTPQSRRRLALKRNCVLESLERRSLMAASILASSYTGYEDDTAAVVSRIITPQTAANSTASQYPSVGLVGDTRGSFCTGTLISTEYVLTAAHCAVGVANSSGRFIVGGQTYATSQVIVHPNYNSSRLSTDTANDIAIYKLNRPVSGITPSPIYRGTPRVGETLTLVGFGGARNSSGGGDGSFGTKRVGTTPIDRVSQTIVGWRYDNLTESNTAPGDSGGPAYLNVGGVYYVAGVTSGGSRSDAGIGDNSFDTRVDAYKTWIDLIVGTTTTTILNLPTVSIRATDAAAGETTANQTANRGTFVIQRTGATSSALTVQLATSGTATNGVDYTTIASTVTIPAGSASFTINLSPRDDSVAEGTETAVFAIAANSLYNVSSTSSTTTISIVDNEVLRSNDNFANRQTITGSTISVIGSNASATRETGEPNVAGVSGGKSIWYAWRAPTSGTVSLSTAGSSFDTTLGVYTGTAVRSLRLVTSNDDENYAGGILTSKATFSAVAGTTYQILVDGYGGASGSVSFSLNQAARQRTATTTTYAAPTIANYHQAETTATRTASNNVRDLVFASLAR